jgi:thioredoxin-like negative regulator of GroEL
MREILWVAAIAVVAMLLFRQSRLNSTMEPPDDAAFTAAVVAPSHTVPVVVKFGAQWCGPCRAMERELDKLEAQFAGRVRVFRVDIDEHAAWADHFGVGAIPDTIVFHAGKAVAREGGMMRASELEEWLRPWMK